MDKIDYLSLAIYRKEKTSQEGAEEIRAMIKHRTIFLICTIIGLSGLLVVTGFLLIVGG